MLNNVASPPDGAAARSDGNVSVNRWRLLHLPLDRMDMEAALQAVANLIESARRARQSVPLGSHTERLRQIVTLNPEMVMAAQRDVGLRGVIQRAALVVPDGVGVLLASRLLRGGLPARVAGVDLIERFAPIAAERGYRLFLLGGRPGVAREAARRLRARSPGLTIAGVHDGSSSAEDAPTILSAIHDAEPDLLCVAFGSPTQELWLGEHRQQLGAVVAVGVGGALDFIAGAVKRAPSWMRALGLEWLYRLAREPWRWRRMLALPRFTAVVLRERIRA